MLGGESRLLSGGMTAVIAAVEGSYARPPRNSHAWLRMKSLWVTLCIPFVKLGGCFIICYIIFIGMFFLRWSVCISLSPIWLPLQFWNDIVIFMLESSLVADISLKRIHWYSSTYCYSLKNKWKRYPFIFIFQQLIASLQKLLSKIRNRGPAIILS
jgi:hypothetical protein